MKNILFGSLAITILAFGFVPQASADSAVSISFSSGGHQRYEGHTPRYKHHTPRYKPHNKWERHAYRSHGRAHRTVLYRPLYRPYAAVHTPTIIYQNVMVEGAPTSIYDPPTLPLLANQASSSYSVGGQTCREYQSQVVIGGQVRNSYGTACLQQDGVWRIVD